MLLLQVLLFFANVHLLSSFRQYSQAKFTLCRTWCKQKSILLRADHDIEATPYGQLFTKQDIYQYASNLFHKMTTFYSKNIKQLPYNEILLLSDRPYFSASNADSSSAILGIILSAILVLMSLGLTSWIEDFCAHAKKMTGCFKIKHTTMHHTSPQDIPIVIKAVEYVQEPLVIEIDENIPFDTKEIKVALLPKKPRNVDHWNDENVLNSSNMTKSSYLAPRSPFRQSKGLCGKQSHRCALSTIQLAQPEIDTSEVSSAINPFEVCDSVTKAKMSRLLYEENNFPSPKTPKTIPQTAKRPLLETPKGKAVNSPIARKVVVVSPRVSPRCVHLTAGCGTPPTKNSPYKSSNALVGKFSSFRGSSAMFASRRTRLFSKF